MINGKTITIVVPCKNESAIIAGFIKRVPSYVDEILIVDNNSTDNTALIAKQAGAKVITEKRAIAGIGYGFAHQTGIEKATGDWIVAMDGDDTYPVKRIAAIIKRMEREHIDVLSCNRLPLRNTHAISKTRQLGIRILNILVWLLYGYPIQDILSGMWVAKRTTLLSLHTTSGDWNFSPEIKLNAIMHPRVVFSEYHIDHFVRAKEPSKQQIWKTGINHLLFIVYKRLINIVQKMQSIGLRAYPSIKEIYAK
ncbi:MAG: glycosyl transferase family protein [Microgenomates group bacterium GW2011_GWC1_39_12]|nr:MAG: glycosyl transferase family protein [Microgenomates group bacterium GW2011_GWC1_39_12]